MNGESIVLLVGYSPANKVIYSRKGHCSDFPTVKRWHGLDTQLHADVVGPIAMNSRRIPFITTYSCESSESDNDVEPRTRLFRKQKHKKDSIGGGPSTAPLIPSAVSLFAFML